MSPELLSEWQVHLSIQATAAATLTGLVFIAASINLARIVATPGLPGRVIESLMQFVQVLFISMLMTIPRQTFVALAVEVLIVALCAWIIQIFLFVRYRQARASLAHPRWWLPLRILQTHVSTLPFLIGAGALLLGWQSAFYWLVVGFFFSFIVGLMNSLVLLINVGRRKELSDAS